MGLKKRLEDATERINIYVHRKVVRFSRKYIAGRLRKAYAKSVKLDSDVPRRYSNLLTEVYLAQKDEGFSDIQQAIWLFYDKWILPIRDLFVASRPDYWVPLVIWWIKSK